MNSGFRSALIASVLAAASGLVGCGGDVTTTPTPVTNAPDVAGSYNTSWTLQVLRKSDGFQKEFYCPGRMTLSSSASGTLSGFVVVDLPCAPESYDLTGKVLPGGALEVTTDGPKPTEGPCPGGHGVHYTGQAMPASGRASSLSLRGVTDVTCPEFGEHRFTYLIESNR